MVTLASQSKGATVGAALVALALGACGHGDADIGIISVPQGRLWGARFAPDGRSLAVAYGDEDKLGVIDLDAVRLTEVATGGSYLSGTAWTAAGDAFYYNGAGGVFRVARGGGPPTMINDGFATLGVDVSPDGTRLAYGVNGGPARIYTLATSREAALDRQCSAIRFAPTGDRVACISGGALVVIDLGTMAVTTVVDTGVPFIAGLDWYSDGQRILFTSTRGLEQVDLSGTRTIVVNAFAAIEVDLAPDDGQVVYAVNGQSDLNLLGL